MTYAKVLFVVGGVAILGMLGADKLRAQPSPVDCDRYAQEYARTHSRNGQVIRGAGSTWSWIVGGYCAHQTLEPCK